MRGLEQGVRHARGRPWRRAVPGQWEVWQLPHRPLAVVLAVELVALAVVVREVVAPAVSDVSSGAGLAVAGGWSSVLVAIILLALATVHNELDVHALRRDRLRFDSPIGFNFIGVWTLAAGLVLPPVLLAPVVLAMHYHMFFRIARKRSRLYRAVFNSASVLLAAFAAHAVVAAWGDGRPAGLVDAGRLMAELPGWVSGAGVGWVVAMLGHVPVAIPALLAYAAVNHGLVLLILSVANPHATWADRIGGLEDNLLEYGTLLIGAGVAALTVTAPALMCTLPGPLLALQRLAVLGRLRRAMDVDTKTGLLTWAAWHRDASRLLVRRRPGHRRRAGRARPSPAPPIGVLMCDLDHFKQVNDRYGHLAGDQVLWQVARLLRAGVREHDLVGRFGGEEFAVLLRGPSLPGVHVDRAASVVATAERIRSLVAGTQLTLDTPDGPLTIPRQTISVGACVLRPDATAAQLDDATRLADAALLAGKRAGRDRVRLADEPAGSPTRDPACSTPQEHLVVGADRARASRHRVPSGSTPARADRRR